MQYPVTLTLIANILSIVVWLLIGPAPFMNVETNIGIFQVLSGLLGSVYSIVMISTLRRSLSNAFRLGFSNNLENMYMLSFSFSCVVCFSSFIGPTIAGFFVEAYGFEGTTSILFVASLLLIIINLVTLCGDVRNSKPGPGCESACVCLFIPQGFAPVSRDSNETTGLIHRKKYRSESFSQTN